MIFQAEIARFDEQVDRSIARSLDRGSGLERQDMRLRGMLSVMYGDAGTLT